MDSMGYGNALKHLGNIGSAFAKDTRKRLRELEAKASTAGSLERAIEKAQKQRRTKRGWPHVANDPHGCSLSRGRRRGSTDIGQTQGSCVGGSRARLQVRGGACQEIAVRSLSNRGDKARCQLVLAQELL
ncbi:unnamed protein product, partial [Ectocarpus sp. 6 AP-2014]